MQIRRGIDSVTEINIQWTVEIVNDVRFSQMLNSILNIGYSLCSEFHLFVFWFRLEFNHCLYTNPMIVTAVEKYNAVKMQKIDPYEQFLSFSITTKMIRNGFHID